MLKKFILPVVSAFLTLSTTLVFAAGGVRVNGDLTLTKDTIDPYRILYFSDGSSQQFASPWSFNNLSPNSIFYNVPSGKVGIGITSPSTELEVGGTVKATTFLGDGTGVTNVTAATVANNSVTSNSINGVISANKLDLSGMQKKYGRIAIVAKTGGNYDDPEKAMTDYATWCDNLSMTNPCLLKIMPGVYTVTSPVIMQPYIDIEGSGEQVSKITSTQSNDSFPPSVATVQGANNAELRFITVESTGTSNCTAAILNSEVSPSLLHVRAIANGGASENYGVCNQSSSSPTMVNVTATASGGDYNHGVINNSSSPTMTNVTATGSGGAASYGVYNNSSTSTTMTNVTVMASGGTNNYGVYNDNSSPMITNATITVSGGADGESYGVYNSDSSPTMTSVIVKASGGIASYGVSSDNSGTVKIDHSVIKGTTNTISTANGVTTFVGNTQLDGGVASNSGGDLTCIGAYSSAYTALDSDCQ